MGKRLAQLIAAGLRQPIWVAAVAMAGSFGVLVALLFVLDALADPPDVLRELLAWLFLLWFVFVTPYLAARIYRHYRYGKVSLREALIVVAVFHALGLAALLWGTFVRDNIKSYAAEFVGFDYWVYPATFVAAWAFVSLLITLRYWKPARTDATGMRLACAAGICAFLLAIAAGVKTIVPEFRTVYASFGADLPGPTRLMFDVYPYAYALPLLGAVLAACGLLLAGARARRVASDGQIAVLAVSNLAVVFVLTAMCLPMFKLCGGSILDQAQETGVTRLHAAASLGRTESVMRHLARGAPVDVRDKRGNTPLHHGALEDRAETARVLLARGADAGARNESGMTPLHAAVGRASWRDTVSLELVQLLLERGAPVNAERDSGITPLHVAASSRRTELAALLLGKGADINAVAEKGTPLDFAYEGKNQAMTELLRQHGAVRSTEQQRAARKRLTVQASADRAGSCGA